MVRVVQDTELTSFHWTSRVVIRAERILNRLQHYLIVFRINVYRQCDGSAVGFNVNMLDWVRDCGRTDRFWENRSLLNKTPIEYLGGQQETLTPNAREDPFRLRVFGGLWAFLYIFDLKMRPVQRPECQITCATSRVWYRNYGLDRAEVISRVEAVFARTNFDCVLAQRTCLRSWQCH